MSYKARKTRLERIQATAKSTFAGGRMSSPETISVLKICIQQELRLCASCRSLLPPCPDSLRVLHIFLVLIQRPPLAIPHCDIAVTFWRLCRFHGLPFHVRRSSQVFHKQIVTSSWPAGLVLADISVETTSNLLSKSPSKILQRRVFGVFTAVGTLSAPQ